MHPKALVDACAELVRLVLTFEHPADAVVSRYFREHRGLGPRERATLAETVYNVLRKKLLFEQLARSGAGPKERRLAILGFHGPRDFVKSALTEQEKSWLDQCDAVRPEDLLAPHRHNLPEWLVAPLKEQLGESGFWALADSLAQPAPLDLRVNALKEKRDQVQKELAQAAIKSVVTPYSPWGLRIAGKPALTKLDAFTRGAIEVQDEGSQLLALLLDAKRGEMVVDFCAGAGGKTLAIGAAMRSTGRLYAFDVSAHRLEALKPRLARSGLSNVHPAAIAHERDERVKRLAGKQTAILESAARLVKPGGRLVYATCSVLPQENEAIAEAFGAAHADFEPQDAGALLTQLKVPDAARLCHGGASGTGYLRLWPHLHQTDGFFAAVWTRRA